MTYSEFSPQNTASITVCDTCAACVPQNQQDEHDEWHRRLEAGTEAALAAGLGWRRPGQISPDDED